MTMPSTPDHEPMRCALALARNAVGLASPNPTVGCVLVKDEKIIGEGAHLYDARDHAEIVALHQAGSAARGATAYVTLEPCCHTGRTGPCADALIAAGIARAVVATADPNPLVAGQGIARLRAAGIEVAVGLCEHEARALNDAFAKFIQTRTPFVTLKAALSSDGFLAPPPAARVSHEPGSPTNESVRWGGQPHWLTGPAARAQVQQLRHASDAILTGLGTVLADNPALTDRSGLVRRRPLLRVVLDSSLATPLDSQLLRTAHDDLLILCAPAADSARERELLERGAQVARIPALPTGGLYLDAALAHLATRQILSVLVEAGTRVNGAFLQANLVDQLVLFHAPAALGPGALPFAEGIASPRQIEQTLQRPTRSTFGADTCLTGYLHDPWQTKT